jgi:hypothetical protein
MIGDLVPEDKTCPDWLTKHIPTTNSVTEGDILLLEAFVARF